MTFFQFARNNVTRNGRAYAAYFLSSTFAILLFFLYATLINHPDLQKGYVNHFAINGMQVAQGIIFVFSFFSILYSMGSFLRGRSKEFGLLTILGISPSQLIWLIFLENILLGLASILVGVSVGLLTSQLFLMLGSLLLDIPSLPFYLPGQALLLTCMAFLVLFLLVSVTTLFFLRTTTVLTLLTGSRRPKPEPRASLVLAFLAVVLLITGYAVATSYRASLDESLTTPLIVIVLTAIGTYLLYGQLSVFLLQFLKKRRNYSWRGTHLLWLSELAYNMKDNARLFFAIAMLLSVAFTATGALAVEKGRAASDTPVSSFTFSLVEDQSTSTALPMAKTVLDRALNAAHFSYTMIQVPFIAQQYSDNVMSVSNYNRLALLLHYPRLTVQPGEAVAFPYQQKSNTTMNAQSVTLPRTQSKEHVKVVPAKAPGVLENELFFRNLLVLTDQDYQEQSASTKQGLYVVYNMAQWKMTTELATDVQNKLQPIDAQARSEGILFLYDSRALDYLATYQLPNILVFIGLFTTVVFLIASGSFLYFRLYTTLNENKKHYRALSKIGLTETEMSRSVTIQVITLFLAPLLMAGLNAAFAMVVLKNNEHVGTQVLWPTVQTIGVFLTLQVLYCLVVRAQYVSQLKQVLV